MITLKHVAKVYDNACVLDDINIQFKKGTVNVIIGPSGSGKSTLLRTINYLAEPEKGQVFIHDELVDASPKRLRKARKAVGMVFQDFHLFSHKNVLENCMLAQINVLNRAKDEAKKVALKHLKTVHMESFATRRVDTLSGGQKQRVAIARALAMDPEVLLLDEPTSALDPETVGEVLEAIRTIAKKGMTLILATHEMAFARDIADRTIFMDEGKIVEDRNGATIFETPHHERTCAFLSRFTKTA